MKKQLRVYASCVDYAKRLHNLSFQPESFEYFDLADFNVNNEILPGKDVIMLPSNYDMFSFSNESRWVYSGIYASSDTFIISAPPKMRLVSSVNFFNTDTETMILLVLSILLVSFILSFNVINNQRPSLKNDRLNNYAETFFRKIWDIASLIFFEPLNEITNNWSERIAIATWLISLTFFYGVLSCYLKTEFFQEEYLVIDNVDQLIRQTRLKPLVMEKSYEYNYLLEKLSANDDSVRKWLNNIDLFVGFDMFTWDFYSALREGGALVTSDLMLLWAFGALMEWGETDELRMILEKGGLYVSRSIVRSELLVIPVDETLFKNNSIFREYYTHGMMSFFECKPFHNMDLYNKYPLDIMSWSFPVKTASRITIFAVGVPFYIIPIGYSFSLFAFLMEYLIGKKSAKLGPFELG